MKPKSNRAEKQYRMRLLEALHKTALKRGLYTEILPPDPPRPDSDFRLVVDDILFLMAQLPQPASDDVPEEALGRIKSLLDGCRTNVMSGLTPNEVYSMMRSSYRRAAGRDVSRMSDTPQRIQTRMLSFVANRPPEIVSLPEKRMQ